MESRNQLHLTQSFSFSCNIFYNQYIVIKAEELWIAVMAYPEIVSNHPFPFYHCKPQLAQPISALHGGKKGTSACTGLVTFTGGYGCVCFNQQTQGKLVKSQN